ncbi:hypothetical protein CMI37_31365 [Candidatus Pacearchaeota archaeon]|nr:hypothetical protein [Candidatus Pacearchaeota archaeon]
MPWEYRGFQGGGSPPPLLGNWEGNTLLVVGGGRCVFDDLAAFLRPPEGRTISRSLMEWSENPKGRVMAVNDIGMYLECSLTHWTSLHPNFLIHWNRVRRDHSLPPPKTLLHSYKDDTGIDYVWEGMENTGGLSGLFAASIGILMGYDRVILAGCPTNDTGRFFDPHDSKGNHGLRHVQGAWKPFIDTHHDFAERTRSLSGFTKSILGPPPESWI